jgi:hypothetical protein
VRGPAGEPHLVRDDDHRHAVAGEPGHRVEDLADHLRVERRGRLVEQHELGVHRQRTGDGHPLLLAPGELRGQLAGLVGDPDPGQQLARPLLRLALGLPADLDRAQRDVLQDGPVGEQVEALEDHPDVRAQARERPALRRKRFAVQRDRPRVDRLQPVDRAAERRLPRSGRADHHDDLAPVHGQVDVLEDVQVPEVLVDPFEDDERPRAGARARAFGAPLCSLRGDEVARLRHPGVPFLLGHARVDPAGSTPVARGAMGTGTQRGPVEPRTFGEDSRASGA